MSHDSYPDHPLDEDRILQRILPATLMEWIDPAQADSPQALLALWRSMAPRLRELFPGHKLPTNPREFLPDETPEEAVERVKRGSLVVIGIEHDFGSIEAVDHEFDPTGRNREWCWQLNRLSPYWRILAWGAEQGDDEALDALLRAVRHFLRWPVPQQENGFAFHFRAHRTIDTGIRMGGTVPVVLPTILEHADDELLIELCANLLMQQQRLRWNHRTGNWLTMEMKGLFASCAYLPFARAYEDCASYALGMAAASLDEQILPDGMQYELAPSYHLLCANNFMPMVTLAKKVGYEHEQCARLEAASIAIADCLGQVMLSTGLCAEPQDCDRIALERLQAVKPDIDSHQQAVGFLPNAGYVTLRCKGTSVFFDAGPFGRAHQHQDKLNLIYTSGKSVGLLEYGKHTYEDSCWRKLCLSTAGHNCLLVDGTGQWRTTGDVAFPYPAVDVQLREDEQARSVIGRYDEPYGQHWQNLLPAGSGRPAEGLIEDVRHERAVQLLADGLLLVEDRIVCEQERLLTLLWHINSTTIDSQDGDGLACTIDGRAFRMAWWSDAELSINSACGRHGEELDHFLAGTPAGWSNYQVHDSRGDVLTPCLRIEQQRRCQSWRVVTAFAFDVEELSVAVDTGGIVLSSGSDQVLVEPRLA